MTAFTIIIPESLNQDLITAARQAERTKTDLVRQAITQYVYDFFEDIKDADIALARSENPDAKFYSSAEATAYLVSKLSERAKRES